MTSLTKPVAPTAKSETSVSAPRKIFRHNERLEWRLRADRTNVVRPDFMAILANRSANLGPAQCLRTSGTRVATVACRSESEPVGIWITGMEEVLRAALEIA